MRVLTRTREKYGMAVHYFWLRENPRSIGRVASLVVLLMAVTGCAVRTEQLSLHDNVDGARADLASMFAEQEPVVAPIGLYEAMARAVRHNLDSRLRAMEEALAQDQVDVAQFDLLPQIEGSFGFEGRNNISASSSESILSGR